MISCQAFRSTIQPGSDDANLLEHLRSCDACLDYALSVDPDFFFRAAGGGDMVPPGGIDNFVSDVMAQVRLVQTESSTMRSMPVSWYFRTAAAALLVVTAMAGVFRYSNGEATQPPTVIAHVVPRTTKAVVETYETKDATIVEVPAASASDPKIVMIYDESLPADL